jgi:integrase
MNTAAPQTAAVPSSPVVKVQFKKPGRRPKVQQPANVIPAIEVPESEEKKSRTLQLIPNSGGIYKIPGQYGFYVRPYVKGIQRKKKLDVPLIDDEAIALRRAIAKHVELLEDLKLYERGKIERDPLGQSDEKTLVELCSFYRKQGFPRRKGNPVGKELAEEERRVQMLERWPRAKHAWREFTLEDCQRYHDWRVRQLTRLGKGGGRTVDLELTTLSNIFRCSMRNTSKTGVTHNPFFTERPRFRKASDVEHCREFMPRNADELNALCRAAQTTIKGEAIAFAIMFQAMIGHRINEMLKLRMDAKHKLTPGFVESVMKTDKKTKSTYSERVKLYLHRSEGHKGAYGHIEIFEDLDSLIEAHRIWHKRRYPEGNPWYFPSPLKPDQPLDVSTVTKALVRIAEACGQPKRTSHGLRSYRVNVLRSQGKTDDEIALRLGQKTRGDMIVKVYGEGLDYKIGYMPEEITPMWDQWLPSKKRTGVAAEQTKMF